MNEEKATEEEGKILENRKEKLKELFFKKNLWVYVILILLLVLAWHTRTVNIPNLKDVTTGDYTLGPDLDPFLFLRYAKYIVDHGSLMDMDYMRYVPLGYHTAQETRVLPYMIAYFHKAFVILKPGISINYSALMFPVIMFLLTVVAFFLFIRKVFEEKGIWGGNYCISLNSFFDCFPIIIVKDYCRDS